MTKRNSNLQLVANDNTESFCRHCGEAIKMKDAREHLFFCRPEIHAAIAREYNAKEKRAMELAYAE